ncbi:major facilitator superfamily protein [Trichomonas vaginalis G3]|uniref:Major facilitator superfamily protein n=1 Tax=Trichomonas vaginalis (strain ATCC PRA-98 / G3) TaxID=412133 RepID=A2EVL1_TRIV3|nr:major facilitator superfamily transporter [Trichomonas vaginalis G3]EAY03290.1 major facilitator superfamily protein [Trichomonas vaginalis G3]KAI5531744.1 glucose import [Trichomonas vaginalis G3]|eukprot:XP_001315513.1 major facilitator superfamily transporter [Trichomonas vaginalis G3]
MVPKIQNPYINALILSMGAMDVGFGMVYPAYTTTAISKRFDLSLTEETMFNVGGILSAIVGSLAINVVVNKFGKRVSGLFSGLYATIMWILLACSVNKGMLFTFRCLSCLSIGLWTTIVPAFLSEVAPENRKYFFGFVNQIAIAFGFLFVTIIGAYLKWEVVAGICAVPNFIIAVLIMFIPEKEQQTAEPVSWAKVCSYHKALFIGFLFMFFLQFSGVQPVMSNMEKILSKANLSISIQVIGIIALIVQLITTCISAIIVDKLGNYLCWMISSVGQLIAFVLLCLHQKKNLPTWVFIIGLFLEQIMYGVGIGPIPFACATVQLEMQYRATAMAITVSENWALTAFVNLIWPYMEKAMTLGYAFLFFAGMMVLSIIFGIVIFGNKLDQEPPALDNKDSSGDGVSI